MIVTLTGPVHVPVIVCVVVCACVNVFVCPCMGVCVRVAAAAIAAADGGNGGGRCSENGDQCGFNDHGVVLVVLMAPAVLMEAAGERQASHTRKALFSGRSRSVPKPIQHCGTGISVDVAGVPRQLGFKLSHTLVGSEVANKDKVLGVVDPGRREWKQRELKRDALGGCCLVGK